MLPHWSLYTTHEADLLQAGHMLQKPYPCPLSLPLNNRMPVCLLNMTLFPNLQALADHAGSTHHEGSHVQCYCCNRLCCVE
jgi:hypothetical protein